MAQFYGVEGVKLTAIANAIRDKTGKSDEMTVDEMPSEIKGIPTGGGGGRIEPSIDDYFRWLSEDAGFVEIPELSTAFDLAIVECEYYGNKSAFWLVKEQNTYQFIPQGYATYMLGVEVKYNWEMDCVALKISEYVTEVHVQIYETGDLIEKGSYELLAYFGLVK